MNNEKCAQLKKDLQTLKDLKPKLDAAFESGKADKDFSKAMDLRKEALGLIEKIESELELPLREERLKDGDEIYVLDNEMGNYGKKGKITEIEKINEYEIGAWIEIKGFSYFYKAKDIAKLKSEQGHLKYADDQTVENILDINKVGDLEVGSYYQLTGCPGTRHEVMAFVIHENEVWVVIKNEEGDVVRAELSEKYEKIEE